MSRRWSIVSFDLDGTLVDTAAEIAEAANRTIEECRLARQSVESITMLIGAGTRELMLRLLQQARAASAGRDDAFDDDEALARFAVHYAATAGTTCRLYPGAIDALERLRAHGVRLACLTNKEERYSRSVLQATQIESLFDLLVAGDTLPFKKPDARVVKHVLAALGGEAAAMAHVGDSRTDVLTARNAGIAAWAVPWGYNGGEPVAQCAPDRIFDSLTAVADAVLVDNAAG